MFEGRTFPSLDESIIPPRKMRISRPRTIKKKYEGILPKTSSLITTTATTILSAIGSIILPTSVISFLFLAIYPSKIICNNCYTASITTVNPAFVFPISSSKNHNGNAINNRIKLRRLDIVNISFLLNIILLLQTYRF